MAMWAGLNLTSRINNWSNLSLQYQSLQTSWCFREHHSTPNAGVRHRLKNKFHRSQVLYTKVAVTVQKYAISDYSIGA